MARTKRDEPIVLTRPHKLSMDLIERLTCPPDRMQAFLRDAKGNGLRVRVTANGAKSYVFEGKLRGKTIRRTLGGVAALTIEEAQKRAREEQATLDRGLNPATLEQERIAAEDAAKAAQQAQERRETVTALTAWAEYVKEGKEVGFTRRGPWSVRHCADHAALADEGGKPFKRGKGTTAPGPLHALLSRPLVKLDADAIEAWLKDETRARPARAALAFRQLRGFLNWCAQHRVYRQIAHPEAHEPKSVRRLVRKQAPKIDTLQREQLAAWFKEVRADSNPTAAAYLQALLLTGARKGEIAGLRWEDVEFQHGGSLTIRDKVEGMRVIPLPPYLAQVLAALPRKGEWVFGPSASKIANNATYNHRRALARAGLPHVSLHGLRRAFGTLSEWVECPAGIAATIQGHKPSATAEKHYRARPLDLLRMWHVKIEAWMLSEAGIEFVAEAQPGRLHLVNSK